MKKFLPAINSFRVKVALTLVVSLVLVAALSILLIYQFGLNSQFEQLREQLKIIARTSSIMVDPDTLLKVPLNPEGIKSDAYQEIADNLRRIKKVNPQILYIYIMGKTDKPNTLCFIVDPDPIETLKVKKNLTSFPGEKYDAAKAPEMLNAFTQATADRKIVHDAWGASLSGYAPVYDKEGKAVAILGVDLSAANVYKTQQIIYRRSAWIWAAGILFAVILGFFLSRTIAAPIKKLVEATRRIAAGDLNYKVSVDEGDEIGQLAKSFNEMGEKLAESRKQLEGYFYRIVQSFIRVLEAKDPYTRGHSDRVADYSYRIALKMGFSEKDADLLRRAAELHDIGKIKIDESILNKKDKLSDSEWTQMHEHPALGEEICKLIFLDPRMPRAIRQHHERFDGTGYPDGIRKQEIDLAAQIISVADVFDAMTSSRAYRAHFDRQKAIGELKQSRGTQLSPQVVDVFCRILEEDPSLGSPKIDK